MRKFFLSICVFSLLLLTCRKEQPQMATFNESCDCAHEVSAEFTIEEVAGQIGAENDFRTLTDTAYSDRNIRFHALEEDAEYTWYIGSEVIFDRTVYRNFPAEFSFQDIPISLRVDKIPHHICFPDDDGVDSLEKTLSLSREQDLDEFYEEEHNYRFDGLFRFYDSYTEDSVDLRIERWYLGQGTVPFDAFRHLKVINTNPTGEFFDNPILNWGDTIFFEGHQGAINYREFWFTAAGYSGILSLTHDLTGEVKFSLPASFLNPDDGTRTFTGRKLN